MVAMNRRHSWNEAYQVAASERSNHDGTCEGCEFDGEIRIEDRPGQDLMW